MRYWMMLVPALAMVAACQQQPAAVTVDGAWVRLPAVADRPGAAYFTIHGGPAATTLVKVDAPFALRTEVHETVPDLSVTVPAGENPPMKMQPLTDPAVPAGGKVEFKPGGKHVMVYGIGPNVKPGDTVPLILSFATGERVEVQAKVTPPGADMPMH